MPKDAAPPTDAGPHPDPAARAHRRARRIGCAALLVLLALAIWIVMRDDPPPEDADLLPPPIAEVPLSESVYGALLDAVAELPEEREWSSEVWAAADAAGEECFDPWGSRPLDRAIWSTPERVAERDAYYVEASPRIDRIAAALGRSRGGWPAISEDWGMPEVEALQSASRMLRERALHLRARGDLAGAAADLEAIHRLGESVLAEGPRSWVQGLVACADLLVAENGLESLLHDGDLPSSLEAAIIERAPILDRDPEAVARCFRHEYAFMRRSVTDYVPSEDPMAEGPPLLLDLFYKSRRTLGAYARAMRHDIAQIDTPPPRRRTAEEWTEEGALRRAILRANSGEWLIARSIGQHAMILEKFDRLRRSGRALRTLVALRAYERGHGALPPDLETLVAEFPALVSVPIDPWSGAPLRYDPARRILWSVGEDGVDGNGAGWEEFRDDPEASRFELSDWVWPIPPLPGG